MSPISGFEIVILKLTRNQNSEALVSNHYLHHSNLIIFSQLLSKGE
jgi:nucleoside diphosphate kinase